MNKINVYEHKIDIDPYADGADNQSSADIKINKENARIQMTLKMPVAYYSNHLQIEYTPYRYKRARFESEAY